MKHTPLRYGALLVVTLGVGGLAMRARHAPPPLLNGLEIASLQATAQDIPGARFSGSAKGSGKLIPTHDDAIMARVIAQILSQSHYLHHSLDKELAGKMLDQYLDALDPRHLYFLQTDSDSFNEWRGKLDTMLLKNGDTSPADRIFVRLLERVDQQSAYVNAALKTEKFAFDGNDMFQLDRKSAPRPKDAEEAKALWRENLRYEYLQEKLNKKKPEEIVQTLTRRYARNTRELHDLDDGDVFELFMNALAHVYDPHTDYLGKSTLDSFNIQMRLSLFGIGAVLQSEDGYAKIQELTPGGPAAKGGKLKPGDRVVAVAQGSLEPVDVVDMKLDKVVEKIRGPKGTEVRLTVIPAGAADPSTRKVITIMRDEVKLENQEAKAKIIDTTSPNGKATRLGVIDLPSFYSDMDSRNGKSTTTDIARLVKKLKAEKVDGIVMDLRNNPGGSLQEVIKLTGLFIKPGPVVQVKDSNGSIQVDNNEDSSLLYTGPMVILTNKFSASASEILAGALQDYGRALIVGDSSTYGKGTVQTVAELGQLMQRYQITTSTDPGALKLTIQKFYRPSGASTQKRGVLSDIVLPTLTNYVDIGEDKQPTALPYDTIPSATFQKENRIAPLLPELKRRSDARLLTDKDYSLLREEIDYFRKRLVEKTVSLNEAQRLHEKADLDAKDKKHKADFAARQASKDKVYLITLRNADLPGLPAPIKPETAAAKTTASKTATQADDPLAVGDNKPAVDAEMEETERILSDLIALSSRVVTQAAPK